MIDLFIRDNYKGDDIECLLYILRTVIFHQPQHKCYRKSPLHLWDELPHDKSLFHADPDHGFAPGSLHAQKFANFIGSCFDMDAYGADDCCRNLVSRLWSDESTSGRGIAR